VKGTASWDSSPRISRRWTTCCFTVDDLLLHGLRDVYYAENQIVKSLPNLIDNADCCFGCSGSRYQSSLLIWFIRRAALTRAAAM
jgi:hypothetical protein